MVQTLLIYALLSVGAVLFSLPFLWMVSTALKPREQVFLFPPQWIPRPILWSNFGLALTTFPFLQYLSNTMYITTFSIVGILLSSSMVAYSFSRLRWPKRDFFFMLLLSTMMLPGQVTMIPVFIVFRKLGWVNTYKPLIVPAFFATGGFYTFLLRQFFMTIPMELSEAARIDGCSDFGIYWRIILPLAKPALTSVAIFSFMSHWNDFMGPLIYLNDMAKYTLSLGLYSFRGEYMTDWNLLMAASLTMLFPCLVIFFFAQRFFIQGITLTGMKG